MAQTVLETLNALNDKYRYLVYSLLHHTKSTAVCEILQPDSQHIINLSHLDRPQLSVISFTPTFTEEDDSSLLALPPHHTLDILSALGFVTPDYTIIQTRDVLQRRDQVCLCMYSITWQFTVLFFTAVIVALAVVSRLLFCVQYQFHLIDALSSVMVKITELRLYPVPEFCYCGT